MDSFILGAVGRAQTSVTAENTAKAMGSGSLEVFSTPALAALMERAACDCVKTFLSGGETTVGTSLNLEHVSATPVGMDVSSEAVLTEVKGRKLTFRIEARDGAGLVGSCTHERVVVDSSRFLSKAQAKGKTE